MCASMKRRRRKFPRSPKPFVFTIARNLLIDRVRREHIVPIEAVADLERWISRSTSPGPTAASSRARNCAACRPPLDRLPPRCREAVILKQIEGLSRREIAARMGISEDTVSAHLTDGMRALADMLYGEPARRNRERNAEVANRAASRDARQIERRAAAWLERRDCDDWSEDDQAELDAWLAESLATSRRLLCAWKPRGPRRVAWRRAPFRRRERAEAHMVFAVADRSPPRLRVAAVLGAGAGVLFRRSRSDRMFSTPVGGHETIASPTAPGSNSTPTPFCARA